MANSAPDGWIDTPTGRIPDPRKQRPHKKVVPKDSGNLRTNKTPALSRAPQPASSSAKPEGIARSKASGQPKITAQTRPNDPTKSTPPERKKKSKLAILIMIVAVGSIGYIGLVPATFFVSNLLLFVSHGANSYGTDADNSSDSDDIPQDSEVGQSDLRYSDIDSSALGKDWMGTVKAKDFPNFKPSVSECENFTDSDKSPAIRCVMTWTNSLKHTLAEDDAYYPSVTVDSNSDAEVNLAAPAKGSKFYDELFDDAYPSVEAGATGRQIFYFEPNGNSTVWVSYDRESEDGMEYLYTSVAKIDVKTLTVTNATWE